MRWVWSLILGMMIALAPARGAETNSIAAGNAVWADIVKNSQAPAPPPEWNKTPPTAEQMVNFKHKAGDAADALADRIKKFYETYPDHPKAAEARQRERIFRQQAVALHNASVPKPPDENAKTAEAQNQQNQPAEEEIDPEYKKRFFEAVARIRATREIGPPAVVAELDKSGHALAHDFPKRPEPWDMLFSAAQSGTNRTHAVEIYKEIAANAPDPGMRQAAADEVGLRERLGKPLALSYKAVDGHEVNLSKFKGKVVLVDFWATWCEACVIEMPNVKAVYEELHPKGFEIVGVSFDEECDDMKRFVARNQIPWPQFCDGGFWKNAINQEFHITRLPTMFLVDKKGVLRDMDAVEGLREKVKALLSEKD